MGAIVFKLMLFHELVTKGIHDLDHIAPAALSLVSTAEMTVVQLTHKLVDKSEVRNRDKSGPPVGSSFLLFGGRTELQRYSLFQRPHPEWCSF